MTNGDDGAVRVAYLLDDDLKNYNFKDYSEINSEEYLINWPSSIDIYNGKLYILDNHYYERQHKEEEDDSDYSDDAYLTARNKFNEKKTAARFVIYENKLSKNELSYRNGCSVNELTINLYLIILFTWFIIILSIVIFLMCINSGENINNSNSKKEAENENINELNKRLNENNDENNFD